MEEVVPPPEPVASRPGKRCQHDYASKWGCPICNGCCHKRVKTTCGICTNTVMFRDPVALPGGVTVLQTETCRLTTHPLQKPVAEGEKCNHYHLKGDKFMSYSRRSSCPICNNCGHGLTKGGCPKCSDCGHGHLKQYCRKVECSGCSCGMLKRKCQVHKVAKA